MIIKKVLLLGILTLIILPGIMALTETIFFDTGFGLPNYELGLIDGKDGWQSDDALDSKGWEVVNRYSDVKSLTFMSVSDFETFSPEDNYVTFHVQTDYPINRYGIGGQYFILKNGYVDIFISKDNINWVKVKSFDTGGRDWASISWGHTLLLWGLNNDIYIRHSAGANSNQDYAVHIERFSLNLEVIIPDEDNDGIPDDEDKCPNTEGEQIIYGCSCEQILDLKPGKDKNANCSPGIIKVFTKNIGWARD